MTLISDSGIEVARWSLRLLGGFELAALSNGESISSLGKRERVLLAVLALSPNCRAPRRKLAIFLWGDATDEAATDNLRVCIFNLRKALGEAGSRVIASDGRDLALDPAAFEVDALQFRRLAAEGGRAQLETAAKLYAGAFLDGLDIKNDEYESWRREESARFRGQMVDVLARLMNQLAEAGATEAAIEAGIRLLRLDPLHEAAVRRLMRLYGDSGRRGAAVQLYRSFADTLKKELSAQPEPATQAVLAEISRGAESPHAFQSEVSAPLEKPPDPKPQPALAIPAPEASAATVPPSRTASRMGHWVGAGALALAVLALLFLYQFAPWGGKDPITIVVFPFANLSGDKGQEFFSDGMTEEIATALTKVPGLRVVARTSVLQSKDPNVAKILKQLHASYGVQGSVRRDGDRLRVTARRVDASGITVWSENYDRRFVDIIPTQEEIARAIVEAMRVPSGLKPGENLVSNRSIDPESYQQFLRGKAALLNAEGGWAEQLALLEPVVAKNPNYAPAWAALAHAYAFAGSNRPGPTEGRAGYRAKMVAAARRAVELDPDLVDAQIQYTRTISGPRKLALTEDALAHALSLDPNHPEALEAYSNLLMTVGRLKEALALKQRSHELDPFIPVRNNNLAEALWLDGQTDAAIALLKDSIGRVGRPGVGAEDDLARIYASMGHYEEAAATLSTILTSQRPQEVKDVASAAVKLLRSAPTKAAEPEKLPGLLGFQWVYLYVGAPDRALARYDDGVPGPGFAYLMHPSYAFVRKTEHFKNIVRNSGLVAYWRERGWPEFCHPIGADDFACQ